MKIKLLICLLVFLFALPVMAAPRYDSDGGRSATRASQTIDNTSYIDINKVFMFVTNHGNFGRDLADFFGNDYGTYFPFTSLEDVYSGANVTSPNYASGLWVGATDAATGDTLIIISEYSDEYVPGPMSGGTFMPDAPEFRVYKLWADSIDWAREDAANVYAEMEAYMSEAVPNQGAPWRVDTLYDDEDTTLIVSIDTIPDIVGDQMLWAVYNDADPSQHQNDAGLTDPLGLEVKQTTFAFNRENPLGNIIFMRHRVFNKGGKTLENCYFSLWADPDLGGAGDDLVGCDVDKSLGYVYNATNSDQYYGSTPPAMGFDFFQGPLVARTAETADLPDGRAWGTSYPDSVNLGMVSFNKYINGTDPDNYQETYGFMNGLTKQGADYVNPATGEVTKYVHTGDPVTGEGDLDIAPADRRWMQSTGPVVFAPGDSTEILAAMIVGRGGDRLSSISVLRYYDLFAQSAYDINFDIPKPPDAPVVLASEKHGQLTMLWGTDSEDDPGTYPFQGYSVFQGETATGDENGEWKLIANFDVVDGIAQILDDVLDPSTGALEYRAVKLGNDGGIQRYFVVTQDYIGGTSLKDGTDYYFRVEAYSYDPEATPKTLTVSTKVITLTPQAPPPSINIPTETSDTLAVEQTAGGSDGVITPLVINPDSLTGDTYEVRFAYDTTAGFYTDTIVENCEYDTTITLDTVVSGDTTLIITLRDITVVPGTCDTSYSDHYDTLVTTYWNLINVTSGTTLLTNQLNQSGDEDYIITEGLMVKVAGPELGVTTITEVAGAGGAAIDPPDNVAYSLNSTGDWYVSSDAGSDFTRLNWRGLIGTYDWEIRFTATGSEYFDWNTDLKFPSTAPFEIWNIGIGTPDDASDDMRINFFILDDDVSGGWSWGDRIYTYEVEYTEPVPGVAVYTFPDDFRIGRIVMNDYSEALTAPAEGTVIRFTTAKINTAEDVFRFTTSAPITVSNGKESDLDAIRAVPNPFYLYSGYDPSPGNKQVKWHHLPAKCTITIYNLGGELIETIEKDDASTAIASWDLLTFNNLPVASGIYIYVVDAPGFGQKIGKMAIFTEEEVLRIY